MQMSEFTTSLIPCDDYARAAEALDRAIDAIDGLSWVKPGMHVGIKANLVAALKPEACATTHPVLVAALVKRLVALGARVTVSDSPGGLYTPTIMKTIYSATGMKLAEEAGAELSLNCDHHTVQINGLKAHSLAYCDWLSECDAVIDFCKLKSHGMVGMSGAVKNLFGVVPGLIKPQMHYQYPNVNDFADMIVDINEFVRPRLALVDAVWGMEGNGPTAGTPRKIGAVIASLSTYEADLAAARLLGVSTSEVPTICAAIRRGLCPDSLEGVKLFGSADAIALSDFKFVPRRSIHFLSGSGLKLLPGVIERCLTQKPAPKNKLCVGCGKCARMCPAGAIEMRGEPKKPRIDRKKCIKCFCCQEFCPKAAMVVKQTLIMRVLQRQKR